MTARTVSAQKLDTSAMYEMRVSARVNFEGAEFAPLYEIEISGDMLSRMLADPDCKSKIRDFKKKD